MPRVSVIIPAAGSGQRFGGEENKIFLPLAGRPIVLRSLDVFAERDDVCQILLVLSAADMETARQRFRGEFQSHPLTPVAGGATRPESVRNALNRVCDEAELVCVHDAVRPCVTTAEIDAVFASAAKTGAAILADPVHGTLKKASADGSIARTVSRDDLWQAQTPQVFARSVLVEAYQGDVGGVTDDAQLVEAMGRPVTLVPGAPTNIKITTPADLALAEAVLASR